MARSPTTKHFRYFSISPTPSWTSVWSILKFLEVVLHEMYYRIKEANRKDISSLAFKASSIELEVDYVYLSCRGKI